MGYGVVKLGGLKEGEWVERENRFAGRARIGGREVRVHVHDPGRLGKLLVPGARVLLLPKRGQRTDYHLIAVYREGYGWVFSHSGYHSSIMEKLIQEGKIAEFRGVREYAKEVGVQNHRIDFLLGDRLLEVKGCTLFQGEYALFPDAPTKRGREHVDLLRRGDVLAFLIMSSLPKYLLPFKERDPKFYQSFLRALDRGVHVISLTFSFDGKTLEWRGRIPFLGERGDRRLAEAVEKGVKEYNARFSPEANVLLSGVWGSRFSLVFHGVFCISCGLFDYFYDFSIILEELGVKSEPVDYTEFWGAYVVRYRIK